MSMRTAIAIMASACVHTAVVKPACVAQAQADAMQADTAKRNEARFATALAAKQLELVTLEDISLGPQSIDPALDFKIDQVTTADDRGATVGVITAYRDSCGGVATEHAQQGTTIFRVNRKRTAGATTAITLCGCVHPDTTCGGMRVTMQPIGYVLPKGTTYGGVVEIEYAADDVALAPDHPCPYAPPPP